MFISNILDNENFLLMTRTGFEPGKEMVFNNWFEDKSIKVKILNNQIEINGQKIYNKNAKNILRIIRNQYL